MDEPTEHTLQESNNLPITEHTILGGGEAPVSEECWEPGSVLVKLYEIEGVLGQGGMGRVYLARHLGWQRQLAIKTALGVDTEALRQEAETWIGLGLYPHLASCYYVRFLEGAPRLFLEYVDGGSLSERIRRGFERHSEIFDLAIQFAWGLDYAHQAGLVHQDVKPQNALVSSDGLLKVTDFGLARTQTAWGLAEYVGLTPAYASPEQAEAGRQRAKGQTPRPLTAATDVYSWGLCLFEMLLGERAWMMGETALETLEAILPDLDGKCIPKTMTDLLRRCFQHYGANRPGWEEIITILMGAYEEACGEPYPRSQPKAGAQTAASLNNRAVSLLDLRRNKEALALWDEALRLQAQHPESTYNRCLYRWRRNEVTSAQVDQELTRVAGSTPNQRCSRLKDMYARESGNAPREGHQKQNVSHSFGGPGKAKAVALSGDGQKGVVVQEKALQLWDLSGPKRVGKLGEHPGLVNQVRFSHDGRFVASAGQDGVRLWDVQSRQALRGWDLADAVSVAFSGDDRILVAGNRQRQIVLWNTISGERVAGWVHTSGVSLTPVASVSITHDGRFVWATSTADGPGASILTQVATGEVVADFKRCGLGALSPDGRWGVTAVGGHVCVFDLQEKKLLWSKVLHSSRIEAISMSRDGTHLASVGMDCKAVIVELPYGRPRGGFSRPKTSQVGYLHSVSLNQDAEWVLAGAEGKAQLHYWSTGIPGSFKAPYELSNFVASEEASRLGHEFEAHFKDARIAYEQGHYSQTLTHLRKARELPGMERHPEAFALWRSLYRHLPRTGFRGSWQDESFQKVFKAAGCNYRLSITADGQSLVLTACKSYVMVFDLTTGEGRGTVNFEGDALHLAVSPNSDYALVACEAAPKYEVRGGSSQRLHPDRVKGVRPLHLVRLADASLVRTFTEHLALAHSLCFAKGGRLAVAADLSGRVTCWDLTSGGTLWSKQLKEIREIHFTMLRPTRDGVGVVVANRNATLFLELADGNVRWSRPAIPGLVPGPKGSYVVTPREGVRRLNLASGELEIPCPDWLEGCDLPGRCTVGANALYDLETKEILSLNTKGQQTWLTADASCAYLFYPSDGQLRRCWLDWDLESPPEADWNETSEEVWKDFCLRNPDGWTETDAALFQTELLTAGLGYIPTATVRERIDSWPRRVVSEPLQLETVESDSPEPQVRDTNAPMAVSTDPDQTRERKEDIPPGGYGCCFALAVVIPIGLWEFYGKTIGYLLAVLLVTFTAHMSYQEGGPRKAVVDGLVGLIILGSVAFAWAYLGSG